MQHLRVAPQLKLFQQRRRCHGEAGHLLRQRDLGCGQIQPHRDAVIVAGREHEGALMGQAAVQLEVARFDVGKGVFGGGVFHAAFAAVIDGKQLLLGRKAGIKACHVEIVEAEHHTGEQLVGGHGALAGAAAELPHAAAAALGQQHRTLTVKFGFAVHASTPFF